jgi:hypothetical protein
MNAASETVTAISHGFAAGRQAAGSAIGIAAALMPTPHKSASSLDRSDHSESLPLVI